MKKQKNRKITVRNCHEEPYIYLGSRVADNEHFWRWGDDNLLPEALALLSRRSTVHRRIINDKADYISGKGFNWGDPAPPICRARQRGAGVVAQGAQ